MKKRQSKEKDQRVEVVEQPCKKAKRNQFDEAKKEFVDLRTSVTALERRFAVYINATREMLKASGELMKDLRAFYGSNDESSLLSQYIPTLVEIEKFQQDNVLPMLKGLARKTGESSKAHTTAFKYFEAKIIDVDMKRDEYRVFQSEWKKKTSKMDSYMIADPKEQDDLTVVNGLMVQTEKKYKTNKSQLLRELRILKEQKTDYFDPALAELLALRSCLDGSLDKRVKEAQVEQCLLDLSSYNDSKQEQEISSGRLKPILANKFGRKYFREFLGLERSKENLDFWEAIEEFKWTSNVEERGRKGAQMFSNFIETGAINIGWKCKTSVTEALMKGDISDRHLFNECQEEVSGLLEDCLRRFEQSDYFERLKLRVETIVFDADSNCVSPRASRNYARVLMRSNSFTKLPRNVDPQKRWSNKLCKVVSLPDTNDIPHVPFSTPVVVTPQKRARTSSFSSSLPRSFKKKFSELEIKFA